MLYSNSGISPSMSPMTLPTAAASVPVPSLLSSMTVKDYECKNQQPRTSPQSKMLGKYEDNRDLGINNNEQERDFEKRGTTGRDRDNKGSCRERDREAVASRLQSERSSTGMLNNLINSISHTITSSPNALYSLQIHK